MVVENCGDGTGEILQPYLQLLPMGLVGNLVWAGFHRAVLTQHRANREAII